MSSIAKQPVTREVKCAFQLKTIEKGWTSHMKVADAVMSGRLSATAAIEMQGAARHGDASFRAGHAHGLLLRTNDLLRSYTDPDYRREKLRYLNHNERTHQRKRVAQCGPGPLRHTGLHVMSRGVV